MPPLDASNHQLRVVYSGGGGFAAYLWKLSRRFTLHRRHFMKRYGNIIGLRPEKLEEYKKLHAAVWPGVLQMIKRCNIRNYSIYLRKLPDGNHYLFSYFEYTGSNFEQDMAM